jgi:histone-lysine N-methyltransferase SETMAR
LEQYHKEGDEFLNHIEAGDEMRVSFVNIETKEKSKQWMHTHSSNKLKTFNPMLSAKKLMAAVFWDRKGVMMGEFMQQGTTITSEVYCETLEKLHRAIQNKRHGILTSGVVLLHDNAHLHTAARTRALLKHFNWELFYHPPYTSNLAPSYCLLFSYLKNWLRSQHFKDTEKWMEVVKMWMSTLAADFFDICIQAYKTYSPIQVPQFRQ